MKGLLVAASFVGLALTVVPSFFVFAGTLTWETHALLMLIGTIVWFGTAGLWMNTK